MLQFYKENDSTGIRGVLFDMDGVALEFTPEALRAVADKTMKLNTGARGLRSIIEETMMDIMFDIPSDKSVKKVVITKPCVLGEAPVKITRHSKKKLNPQNPTDTEEEKTV